MSGRNTLTKDPWTELLEGSSGDQQLHLGNEPTLIDPAQICKSNKESGSYSLNGIKMKATAPGYESKLPEFKKTESGSMGITFYKPDGTPIMPLTGQPTCQGRTAMDGIVCMTFTPALPEKSSAG